MKIAYIAAGAAGMYCGTCIHDNPLAAALQRMGHEVALIPTYTPIRTDEADVSLSRVFYGGINVFLQQKVSLFRHTPWAVDRLLDSPGLLQSLSRFSASTSPADLGALTVSVLEGEEGRQKKELEKLIRWLQSDFRPDIVHLTNAMFVGMARQIKTALQIPVACGLQGEDVFLDSLVEPYKDTAYRLLAGRAADVDAFIAPCGYYRERASAMLQITPESIHIVRPGLNLDGHGSIPREEGDTPFRIGYLARIAPEKGLAQLVDAFRILSDEIGREHVRLTIAGYLGKRDESYFKDIVARIDQWHLAESVEYLGEIDREQKLRFLNRIHVLSVPTLYPDPKARYALEALANGTPVVQPRHGVFPELLEATGGGVLVEPHSPQALAAGLRKLHREPELRRRLGASGKAVIHADYGDRRMAEETLRIYEGVV